MAAMSARSEAIVHLTDSLQFPCSPLTDLYLAIMPTVDVGKFEQLDPSNKSSILYLEKHKSSQISSGSLKTHLTTI